MQKDTINNIIIKDAYEHNLKNISLTIPKYKLIVFTGVSGSGKSSLAFHTIYNEGRRRYVESLSSYARQFLGGNEKPNVGAIEGLAPTISIDQKTRSHNPRSTVGTVTEIYDYLRLLYSKLGKPYCVEGHGEIKFTTIKEIINKVKIHKEGTKMIILSPIINNKKGSHKEVLENLRKENFLRVRINGFIRSLDEDINLDNKKRHKIEIVIDRIVFKNNPSILSRLHDAIEIAFKYGNKNMVLWIPDTEKEELYSSVYACNQCGFSLLNIEPRLFSFNAPMGACYECKGLGVKLEIDEDLLMPNKDLSIGEGGIKYFKNTVNTLNIEWQKFEHLLNFYKIPLYKKIKDLTKEEINIILRGSDQRIEISLVTNSGKKYSNLDFIEGLGSCIQRRYQETTSISSRDYYLSYMSEKTCNSCSGYRLNKNALSVKINKLNISELSHLNISDTLDFILSLNFSKNDAKIAELILIEITNRLSFLKEVGLKYLTLSRTAKTLSGGESQRIRLATQIGSQLTGVIYVLDEPSIGLHQKDNEKLIKILKELKDLGNTVIVVEHDEETIHNADWVVDIGPKAGVMGGDIIYNGDYQGLLKEKKSITADFLTGKEEIAIPKTRRGGNGQVITIQGANENNLKNIDVKIPLNKLIALTGVSGSGKSTLMNSIIYKSINKILLNTNEKPGKHKKITGVSNIDRVIHISQDPIGKTPRSNPATYTSVFDNIRDLYASTTESKAKGFLKGRFSFNVPGGRCENCSGDGVIKVSMQFLPTVFVVCDICDGKRYNDETLMIKYKNKNIFDILNMTITEAINFFENNPKIVDKLKVIQEVGLGYIKLGQPATELSGGESQRVKLSTFLIKKNTKKTLFLLDEPTTGLHSYDVKKLIYVLNKIVDKGDTVVVIEHNLDFIKSVDYIIDLGPEGGEEGGSLIVSGTPEQVIKHKTSYTAQFLKKVIENG